MNTIPMSNSVIVVPYDPVWPALFAQLRDNVAGALGSLAVAIEHVGSTSVVGLAAKPIIDIDVVVPSHNEIPEAIILLAALGYVHQGDCGIQGREAFKSPQGTPAHHLYVCAQDNEELHRHIAFRNYLRRHSDKASEYGTLKLSLAKVYHQDRNAYMDGKDSLVKELLAQSLKELENDQGAYRF